VSNLGFSQSIAYDGTVAEPRSNITVTIIPPLFDIFTEYDQAVVGNIATLPRYCMANTNVAKYKVSLGPTDDMQAEMQQRVSASDQQKLYSQLGS
jgi:hypothetical protein